MKILAAYHILLPVCFAIAMNGIIYTFFKRKTTTRLLPPGYIIGIIWTIIFALLGYAHYLLYTLKNEMNYGSISIVFFILFSLTYPLINAIDEKHGYFLNLISLILSFIVSLTVMSYSIDIFLFMVPLLVWVSIVNLIIYYHMLGLS
jgi:benzodiazapine receptor